MTSNKIIICGGRGGSKRVPGKNLRTINGVSLLHYTLDIATQLEYPIYMSSDSDEILNYAKNYKNTTIVKRPDDLASDTATDIDWIKHLLIEYYKTNNTLPEQLIFLRPTTPFRNIEIIRNAIKRFDSDRYTSLRSVHVLTESSYKTFIISNGILTGLSDEYKDKPNQEVPPTYCGNGYIDILVTQQILEMNDLYGNSIMPFLTEETIEIDTEDNIKYANWLMKEKNEIR